MSLEILYSLGQPDKDSWILAAAIVAEFCFLEDCSYPSFHASDTCSLASFSERSGALEKALGQTYPLF